MKRRNFLRTVPPLLISPGLVACAGGNPSPTSPGSASQESAGLDESKPADSPSGRKTKLGIALLGLGGYADGQIAPALQMTEHCELRGLITGSPDKLPKWQKKYGVKEEHCYTYDNMQQIADNDEIDVVYIITPTATHKDFSLRAAAAGKHVWCEKPMAMDVEECRAIIDACTANDVRLAIGYRMLHEPNTRKLIQLTKENAYGAIQSARSYAGYGGSPPPTDYWRGQRDMGGGALYDMGVYTINGLRYGTQAAPEAVVRASQERQGHDNAVDLTTTYTLRYPGGMLAEGKTSVVEKYNELHIEAEDGWYEMQPMQPYQGVKGSTSDGKVLGPPIKNQQSLQMDNDALAIMNATPFAAPGEMGLRDVAVIRAIIESAQTGGEVAILNQ